MPTKLKICGITNFDDAFACAELGVNFLGFNFFPESSRFISSEKAATIIRKLPPKIKSVGILVRPMLNEVIDIINESGVGWIQIIEPKDFSDFTKIPIPVIISQRIKYSVSQSFELNGAQMILLDTYSAQKLGGSGKTFDWSMIPANIPREKLILAGGITPDNVKSAIERVNPAVIDVASGAELSPGIKDMKKVRRLVEVVKGY